MGPALPCLWWGVGHLPGVLGVSCAMGGQCQLSCCNVPLEDRAAIQGLARENDWLRVALKFQQAWLRKTLLFWSFNPPAFIFKVLGLQVCTVAPGLVYLREILNIVSSLRPVHTRQAFYELSHIPRLLSILKHHISHVKTWRINTDVIPRLWKQKGIKRNF